MFFIFWWGIIYASAPHSSTLAWKIPWTEEPGRLQSMGSLRVRHEWATSLSLFTFMHWKRKWQPTPVLFPGESQGRGAWWAAVYGVAQSRTRLKQLSSSSSSSSYIGIFTMEVWNIFIILNKFSMCGLFGDNLSPHSSFGNPWSIFCLCCFAFQECHVDGVMQ